MANIPTVCDNCESESPFIFTVYGDNSSDTALVGVKPPYCVLFLCKTLLYYEVLVYSSVDNRTPRFEMLMNPTMTTQLLNISSRIMDKAFLKVRAFYDDSTSSRYSGCTYTFLCNNIQSKILYILTRRMHNYLLCML